MYDLATAILDIVLPLRKYVINFRFIDLPNIGNIMPSSGYYVYKFRGVVSLLSGRWITHFRLPGA